MSTTKQDRDSNLEGGFDPRDPKYLDDPYAHYKEMRATCPVSYSERTGFFYLATYEAVRDACRAPADFSSEGTMDFGFGPVSVLNAADDPIHKKQRSLIDLVFTPQRVEKHVPFITQLAESLIDGFYERGKCDVLAEYAFIIPISMIARVLGLPSEDHPYMREVAESALAAVSDPDKNMKPAMELMVGFTQYLTDQVALRQAAMAEGKKPDDLISGLMQAEIDGESLSQEELMMILVLLFIGGHESSMASISNGLFLLHQHPEQRQLLIEDPSLLDNAIEEIIRFTSPGQNIPRVTKHDIAYPDITIPAGSKVSLMLASANRDPGMFDQPDRFDINRPRQELRKHFAFGHGPHACLGSHLARKQVKIAITKFLERMPDYEVDGSMPQVRTMTSNTRNWGQLWLKWDPKK